MLTPSQASASPAGWNGWYTSDSHVIMRACPPSKPRTSRMGADAATPARQEIDPLIERCLKGDQSAWDAVVRLYWRKGFNIAYKFVGRHDEAEDLTQDVFLKLFKSLDTFDRRADFQTRLVCVSPNPCIDHYRGVPQERGANDRHLDGHHPPPAAAGAGPA